MNQLISYWLGYRSMFSCNGPLPSTSDLRPVTKPIGNLLINNIIIITDSIWLLDEDQSLFYCYYFEATRVLTLKQYLSVTSHINCIVARCLRNVVYLTALPISGHNDVALFE